MQADCLFCNIGRGAAAAVKVYEDGETIAFMDLFPASEGHVLVICKAHYENLFEIAPESLAAVTAASQKVARAILQALRPDGLRVMQFNGAAAGQSVFHYHVHLRPAYRGQDLRSHGRERIDLQELERIAAKIRAAL
jgi:histidine triad (HIT) family protein